MNYFAGVDIGSTMTKVVIVSDKIESSLIGPTGPEHRKLANKVMEKALMRANLLFDDLTYIVATGYGRINVPFADKQITEITCHARGLQSLLPTVRTVIDIGGQDSKGIKIKAGKVTDFVMNDKCAAGTGRFLEVIADALGVSLESLGDRSLAAQKAITIGNTCTVFAEHEVISQLANGASVNDLIAGIHEAVATRVYSMVKKVEGRTGCGSYRRWSKKHGIGKSTGRKIRISPSCSARTSYYRGPRSGTHGKGNLR